MLNLDKNVINNKVDTVIDILIVKQTKLDIEIENLFYSVLWLLRVNKA